MRKLRSGMNILSTRKARTPYERKDVPSPPFAKHWCFTLNNPEIDPQDMIDLLRPISDYAVFQLETSGTNTDHYQGYVEFKTRKRLTAVTKIFQAHWTKRYSSRRACRDYCMKKESQTAGPWETGVFTEKCGNQGKRSDIAECVSMIRNGATLDSVCVEHPDTYVRYYRSFRAIQYLKVYNKPPDMRVPKTVHLLYGKTRTGKSTFAHVLDKKLYKFPHTKTCWADGYYGQKTLFFDDFAGNIRLDKMLQMTDAFATQVEIKGDMIWLHHNTVIIATNEDPMMWWPERNEDSREAFFARMTTIRYFHRERTSGNVVETQMKYVDGLLTEGIQVPPIDNRAVIDAMVLTDSEDTTTLDLNEPMEQCIEPFDNLKGLFDHASLAFSQQIEKSEK